MINKDFWDENKINSDLVKVINKVVDLNKNTKTIDEWKSLNKKEWKNFLPMARLKYCCLFLGNLLGK